VCPGRGYERSVACDQLHIGAPRIFLWGADPEAIYKLYLILKTML
jgi:hypothetical protein